LKGMRRRRRLCARGSLSTRPECSSAQHSRLATATRAPGRWQPNVLRVRSPALAAICAAPGNPALLAIQEARVDRPVWVGALPFWDPAVSGRYT
jgi:hypothetical protein